MRDPISPQEWQGAVDAAHANLALDSARLYGLVKGGPEINVARCKDILDRGMGRGFIPSRDCVERYVAELLARSPSRALS